MTLSISEAISGPIPEPVPAGRSKLLDQVRGRRTLISAACTRMLDGAVAERRDLLASEQRSYDEGRREVKALDARITDLEDVERRAAATAAHRVQAYGPNGAAISGALDGGVYRRGDPNGPSFFADLIGARNGDPDSWSRLRRSESENGFEKRALGNTNATGGSGGDFAPPAFLIDQFVKLARPARPTADLFTHADLPLGVSSISVPKITTGSTVALQSTQNTALAQTDLTTGSLSSPIVTIGGKQVVSQQLLDQSGIRLDQVLLEDLAASYAVQVDQLALGGTGTAGQPTGLLNLPGVPTITYADTSPALAGTGKLFAKIAQAIAQVNSTRFLPPTAILMHPRRWGWMQAAFDTSNRPLLTPAAGAFNPVGVLENVAAQALAGYVQNLPVILDASIPTNLGAGGNEDRIIVLRAEDIYLWEMVPPRFEAFPQTYADSLGVLFRCFSYLSLQAARYSASVCVIGSTGLATPAY